MPSRVRQILFPVLAAFIWGTSFVSQSEATRFLGPFAFNALRSAVAALFLWAVVALFRKKRPADFPERTPQNRNRLLLSGALCGAMLTVAVNLQQIGIAGTSVGKTGFITAMYVVLVPVLGRFFGKKAPAPVWAGVAISVAGLYLLCVRDGFSVSGSDLFILACAFAYAGHILIIDRVSSRVNGIELSCVQFAVVSLLSGALALAFEDNSLEGVRDCMGAILYAGVFSSGVAYTLQILALDGRSNPTVVSILLSLESTFGVLSGAILLGETLRGAEYAGCALMLAAVILAQIPGKRRTA